MAPHSSAAVGLLSVVVTGVLIIPIVAVVIVVIVVVVVVVVVAFVVHLSLSLLSFMVLVQCFCLTSVSYLLLTTVVCSLVPIVSYCL